MILIKEHFHHERKLITLCDSSLIGKTFEDNNLNIKITEEFYKGQKLNESILSNLKQGVMFNIVGEESIKIALKYKLITKKNIIKIKKIPHALVI
ncbi:MAG: DUF424 family protein [Nanoarchaeota archaeon]|nr:DUF424 family protein [Nanoarchaeota archaeon]